MTERTQNSEVVLEARGISKAYGAVQALDNVDLDLRRGEVLGLVGDNGAGKTTLVKCLSGVFRPDSGTILIDGNEYGDLTAEFARSLGIETVHQNLSLVDTLDVMQNFFLNRELFYTNPLARALRWLNRRRMYKVTEEHLRALGLERRRQHPGERPKHDDCDQDQRNVGGDATNQPPPVDGPPARPLAAPAPGRLSRV